LPYGNDVEAPDAVTLRQRHMDELGVHVLEVCEDEELLQCGVVPHVAVFAGVDLAPFARGQPEEGNVQEVCFVSVGKDNLFRGDFRRDEVGLDSVSVQTIVDPSQGSVKAPGEREAA